MKAPTHSSQSPRRLFQVRKEKREPLAMVSLYDAPTAALCCDAGVDCLLVGDSMGNVVLGYADTIPVTLDDMVHHTQAVVRGVQSSSRPQTLVVADLPFASYHDADLPQTAARLMRAGARALKLEGAGPHAIQAVRLLTEMGVPVMGHLGFTPQSSLTLNGVVQGKTHEAARQLLRDALELQAAGAFGIVLEVVPQEVAQLITQQLSISTIGIGAGAGCDGQVLVWHDLVGLSAGKSLRFVRRYAQLHDLAVQAVAEFAREVHEKQFPTQEHAWQMDEAELEAWQRESRKEPEA